MRKSEIIIALFILFTVVMVVTFSYMADRMSDRPTIDHGSCVTSTTATVKITSDDNFTSEFRVEIADTPEKHATGLMNRSGLAADSGMLFVFSDDDVRRFWMENTLIPLDMVFIGQDGQIVDIRLNATPLSREIIQSARPCRYVLEVNGGVCQARHIRIGDMTAIEYSP